MLYFRCRPLGTPIHKVVFACVVLIVVLEIVRPQSMLNLLRYSLLPPGSRAEKHVEGRQAGYRPFMYSEQHTAIKEHARSRSSFQPKTSALNRPLTVHLATVSCGKKVPEGLVMLRSAALFATSSSRLVFHVYTQDASRHQFLEEIGRWPQNVQERFELRLYNLTLPNDPDMNGWTNPFFRPCSNHRLFLHSLLPDVDAVIYLDSDLLVLFPIDQLWNTFATFNSSHIAALAPESENPKGGWYLERSKIPYVLPAGLNSGVMLMNLTRLRQGRWTKTMVHYSQVYKPKLELGDQDLINIYFRFHPGEHLLLDCGLNYRTDHCQVRRTVPVSVCPTAEDQGASILHGNREAFRLHTSLRAIYTAFSQFTLGANVTGLLDKVKDNLKGSEGDWCTAVAHLFLKRLTTSVNYLRKQTIDRSKGAA